jgi:hypothetical protein
MWVRVADGNNGVTSVKIEVTPTVLVVNMATVAALNVDREKGIDIEKLHILWLIRVDKG